MSDADYARGRADALRQAIRVLADAGLNSPDPILKAARELREVLDEALAAQPVQAERTCGTCRHQYKSSCQTCNLFSEPILAHWQPKEGAE